MMYTTHILDDLGKEQELDRFGGDQSKTEAGFDFGFVVDLDKCHPCYHQSKDHPLTYFLSVLGTVSAGNTQAVAGCRWLAVDTGAQKGGSLFVVQEIGEGFFEAEEDYLTSLVSPIFEVQGPSAMKKNSRTLYLIFAIYCFLGGFASENDEDLEISVLN
jgi:hypothetical protein